MVCVRVRHNFILFNLANSLFLHKKKRLLNMIAGNLSVPDEDRPRISLLARIRKEGTSRSPVLYLATGAQPPCSMASGLVSLQAGL
jgi:hypothetical protein